MSADTETLAEVLAAHQWHHTRDTHCACGFRTPLAQLAVEGYIAHVAALIEAHFTARIVQARAGAGFWDRLGYDEGMMPAHLPMGVNANGQGPEDDDKAHHFQCWCPDPECPLTAALVKAGQARAGEGALREALTEAADTVHRRLWTEGARQTKRRSYPAGVAWKSAANAARDELLTRAALTASDGTSDGPAPVPDADAADPS